MFKNKNLFVFLFYILVIAVLYAQVVFGGKTLLPNLYYPEELAPSGYQGRRPINTFNIDLASPAFYEMPLNRLVADMYKQGKLPLWNPYQGCGSPLAAQYSTRVFFPYQMLENLSPFWFWDYFMLGRLVIAAFFTYLFLRLLGLSLLSALLGGIFYSLSGSFVWFINFEQFANVAMMVPVCLFSLERLIQFKRRRFTAECAMVFAFLLLAGQPEIAIFVFLLAALYYLLRIFSLQLSLFKSCLKFTTIVLLALGLSSFLIFPFLEFVAHSYNCHPAQGLPEIFNTVTPLRYALSLFLPTFFQIPVAYRIFPHNGIWDQLGGYCGVLVPYLILLGIFFKGKQKRYILFFGIFGLLINLITFGFPLLQWVRRLPLLIQSWPNRWAGPVWTFCFASSAAFSIEVINRASREAKESFRRLAWIVFRLSLCGLGFFLWKAIFIAKFTLLDEFKIRDFYIAGLGGIFIALLILFAAAHLLSGKVKGKSLLYALIALAILEFWFYIPKGTDFFWTALKFCPFLFGMGIVFLLAREKWSGAALGIILVILASTFMDIISPYGFPQRYNLFTEPGYVKFLKKEKTLFRVVAGEGVLMPNFSSPFKIYDIRYINSLSVKHYQNYVDSHLLQEAHNWLPDRLWFTGFADLHKAKPVSLYQKIKDNFLYYSYLGVKYILTPEHISLNLPLVYAQGIRVYENPYAFPRVYIAHRIKVVSSFSEAQELMGNKAIDLRNTAILERQPPPWYKPSDTAQESSRARIAQYSADRIRISAQLKFDGVLVLTDVFYPGWQVYVDKQRSQIYRINGLVRGVFLKKGVHDIIFKYEPASFRMGLIISGISLILCLLLIFI